MFKHFAELFSDQKQRCAKLPAC